jgi:bifunctional non-homologous end joining protein LigD
VLGLAQPGLQVPGSFTDVSGDLVLAAAMQQGLEGIVAKRLSSTYQPWRRSRNWIKTPIRHTAEVVIAGWSPATTSTAAGPSCSPRTTSTVSWSTSVTSDVGTGLTDTARRSLLAQLQDLARDEPAFAGVFARARGWPGRAPHRGPVHWVAPQLVGEVEYRNSTVDRTTPRHADGAGP